MWEQGRLAIRSAPSSLRALREGLVVSVHAPAAGKVTVKLIARGRRIASGSAVAQRHGTVRVRLSKVTRRLAVRKVKLTAAHAGAEVTRTLTLG